MSNAIEEKRYVGTAAVEKLISNTKEALDSKQPKGDYVTFTETEELIDNALSQTKATVFVEDDVLKMESGSLDSGGNVDLTDAEYAALMALLEEE